MIPIATMLIGLGRNMALFFGALWLYRVVHPHVRAASAYAPALMLGGLVGGFSLLGISASSDAAGTVLDCRVLLVLLIGAWAGPFAALAAVGLNVLYQLWLGGPALEAEIGAFLSGAALGALAWVVRGRHRPLLSPASLALLGLGGAMASV